MSGSSRPRVVLLGAHRAVAPLLVELLEDEVQLLRFTSLDHVDETSEPLATDSARGAAVVVLTMGGDLAVAAAERARTEGAVILDAVGALPGATPLWSHIGLPAKLARGQIYAVVPGLAGPLGALLGALAPFRPRLAVISTFESSAIADQAGMDALTDQVRSLLAFRDPEPGVLGERLAFNVIPADDEAAELALTANVRAAAGAGAPLVRLSRHLVPTYSGEGAAIDLAVEGTPLTDAVVAALATLKDLRVGRADAPTPHDASDRDEVLVGRLRVGPGRIALWLASDRLRSTGAVPLARAIRAALPPAAS